MIRLRGYSSACFDRGAPRWKEVLWVALKLLFFMSSWPWPSAWRVALLKAFGAKIGDRVVIRSRVNITFPWRLTLGNDVWIGEETFLLTLAPILIEDDVCISQRAFLCTGSHDFRLDDFPLVTRPITVRRSSWVAAQVFLAPGVEIGEGSLVGPGSVVLESVPPRSRVCGNPAAPIKTGDDAIEAARRDSRP
jgi:putative colanic acid biosynthesis acetyltransferase WcaF